MTRVVLKPTHMIGGYAQQSYGFNYYGTVGSNRDEFIIIRRMNKNRLAGTGHRAVETKGSRVMKIRAQIAMVLNLDKCIGCHTCSVTCKNVWTSREGMEYAWFNNVETKPGIGYPKDWENQKRWKGGWTRRRNGNIEPRIGGKWRISPTFLPTLTYQKSTITTSRSRSTTATCKGPRRQGHAQRRVLARWSAASAWKRLSGDQMGEILGGEFANRSKDSNFDGVQKEIYGAFENTFMMYLPRLCEHCLNPACAAVCPSGAIYKREEDGIVLIDQDKCRGWRMCVSGCPYKKIYYNWSAGKSEKCTFCYPRIEAGQPTVCSETCVGRIRYLGVNFGPRRPNPGSGCPFQRRGDLYEVQLKVFLDPFDPTRASEQARSRRYRRSMAGGSSALARVEDGDGLENRFPAASGIPNLADGLVRSAAVADPGRGGEGGSASLAGCLT